MTAAERLKARFADAIERLCIVEEAHEAALARIAELEEQIADREAESTQPPERAV